MWRSDRDLVKDFMQLDDFGNQSCEERLTAILKTCGRGSKRERGSTKPGTFVDVRTGETIESDDEESEEVPHRPRRFERENLPGRGRGAFVKDDLDKLQLKRQLRMVSLCLGRAENEQAIPSARRNEFIESYYQKIPNGHEKTSSPETVSSTSCDAPPSPSPEMKPIRHPVATRSKRSQNALISNLLATIDLNKEKEKEAEKNEEKPDDLNLSEKSSKKDERQVYVIPHRRKTEAPKKEASENRPPISSMPSERKSFEDIAKQGDPDILNYKKELCLQFESDDNNNVCIGKKISAKLDERVLREKEQKSNLSYAKLGEKVKELKEKRLSPGWYDFAPTTPFFALSKAIGEKPIPTCQNRPKTKSFQLSKTEFPSLC